MIGTGLTWPALTCAFSPPHTSGKLIPFSSSVVPCSLSIQSVCLCCAYLLPGDSEQPSHPSEHSQTLVSPFLPTTWTWLWVLIIHSHSTTYFFYKILSTTIVIICAIFVEFPCVAGYYFKILIDAFPRYFALCFGPPTSAY